MLEAFFPARSAPSPLSLAPTARILPQINTHPGTQEYTNAHTKQHNNPCMQTHRRTGTDTYERTNTDTLQY